MNPKLVLVFHFCISFMSCKSINYKDIVNYDEQSSPAETDNQKILTNKLKFLKVLPVDKEWKNTIDENKLESKTKKKNSFPFAIIVATADENLDIFKKPELKSTYVEGEKLKTIGEEPKPKDKSYIQVKEDEYDHKSILDNDNKSEVTNKNIEEQIEDILLHMNTTSNTGEDDHSEINNDQLISILRKLEIENETNFENQSEHKTIIDKDAEMPELLTDISEAEVGNEEILHKKEDTECEHELYEIQNDPKGATVFNLELGEYSKQRDPCNEHYINFNKDDLKSYPISYVLNKYVFVS